MYATLKQVRYLCGLLAENGYSTTRMDPSFAELGAPLDARHGSVEAWLKSLTTGEASDLIKRLKGEVM
jgi:hypothetical protein